MRTTVIGLVMLAALLGAEEGWAFGRQGHRIVCATAYELLTPAAQERVDRLLAAMPADHRAALNENLRRAPGHEVTFADGCVWPDVVKRGEEYDATYEWHFINVQREDREVALDDCMVGCLLTGIDHHSMILRSRLADWPRAQALMFLGHWLADIHQPMHVSFGDDRGGNATAVRVAPAAEGAPLPQDSCDDLHSIWDYCIIENSGFSEEQIVPQLLEMVYSRRAHPAGGGTPLDWANESLALSRAPQLGYCHLEGERCAPFAAPAEGFRLLPATYYSDQWPALKERMVAASIRLAALLGGLLAEDAR